MGRWLVDGVDLSTYAWNVSNRGASWTVPALRGENEDIANAHGRRYVPGKTFEEGKAHLEMWALGCNPDGTYPESQTRAWQCRQNLQYLASLFTRVTGLIEVVRVESNGYGLVNLHPNPGAEGFTVGTVAYRNEVINPGMTAVGVVTQNANLIEDPTSQTNTGWYEYGNNLIQDSKNKEHRSDATTMVERNLNGGGFENLTAGSTIGGSWIAGANCAATCQTGSSGQGTKVMQIAATATLTANQVIETKAKQAIPVGSQPYARFKLRRIGTGSTARSLGYRINYVDNSSVIVTAGTWNSVTIPTGGTWTDVALPPLATPVPSGAPNFTLELRAQEAWASGEGVQIDAVMFGTTPGVAGQAGPYFDGASSYWGSWSGTAYGSISDWQEIVLPEWTLPSQVAYHARVVVAGTTSLSHIGFIAFSHTASGTQQFWLNADSATSDNVPYSLYVQARAISSGCTIELMYSDDGTTWTTGCTQTVATDGYIAGPRGGEQITTSTGGFATWHKYSLEGVMGYTGRQFALRVSVPVRADGNHGLQIWSQAVTSVPGFGPGGEDTSDSNMQYVPDGTLHASKVLMLKRGNWSFTGRHGMVDTYSGIELISRGLSEATVLRLADITPDQTALSDGVYLYGEFIGGNYGAPSAPTVRPIVDCYDSTGALLSTFTGTDVLLNVRVTGSETWLAATVLVPTLPAGTATIRGHWDLVSPLFIQRLFGRNFMLSNRAAPVGFVSGGLTGTPGLNQYSWSGTANQSVSVKSATAAPTNWRVVKGLVTNDTGYLKVQSTVQTDVTVEASLSIPAAGQVNVGAMVSSVLDADWYAQGMAGSTMAVETYLGTTSASGTLQLTHLQGVLDSPGGITAVRIIGRKSSGSWAYNQSFRFDEIYAWPNTPSGNPRQGGNRVRDPEFQAGATGWTVAADPVSTPDTSGVAVVTTSFGRALKSTGKTQLGNTGRLACVAGDSVFAWGKVRCSKAYQLRIFWYNSSDVFLSTTTVASDSTGVTTNSATVTAPASTAYARVQVWLTTAATGTDTIEIFALYLNKVQANRDYSTSLDPTIWRYVDGSKGSDWLGRPAQWEASADTSRTNVFPNVVTGWDTTLTSSSAPAFRPDGSTGRAIVIPSTTVAGQTVRTNHCPNPQPTTTTDWSGSTTPTIVTAPWDGTRSANQTTGGQSNANTLTNGTFEVDLTGWTEVDTNSIGTMSRDTGMFRSGAASLKLAYGGGGSGQTLGAQYTMTGLTVGASYTIGAWVRSDSTTPNPIIVLLSNSATSQTTTLTANTWTQRTLTFVATATSHSFVIRNQNVTSAGQNVWIDDVTFVRVAAVTYAFSARAAAAFTTGDVITARAKVKCSNPNRGYWIAIHQRSPNLYHISGAGIAGGQVAANSNQTNWIELSVSGTLPADVPAGQLDVAILTMTLNGTYAYAEDAELLQVGDVLLEKTTSGGYFDGGSTDSPPAYQYSWTGTANNSASVYETGTPTDTTAISTPVATAKAYLSGELAVAVRDSYVSAAVKVYGYDDAIRTNPTLLTTVPVPLLGGITSWRDVANPKPYAGVQLVYTERGLAETGTGVTFDNLLITESDEPLAADYPGYFDGDTSSGDWQGVRYASTSIYYAGALRALCERQNEIPIEAQAGGTRAEFTVDLQIPAAFWSDPADRQTVGTVTSLPGTITLDDFAGGSAPIEDAVIDLTMLNGSSPSTGLIITDVESGTWVRYGEQLAAGATVRFDCANLDVILNPGTAGAVTKIRKITKGGDARFFTLNPGIAGAAPRLTVSSTTTAFDGQIQVTVTGRRKYVIA